MVSRSYAWSYAGWHPIKEVFKAANVCSRLAPDQRCCPRREFSTVDPLEDRHFTSEARRCCAITAVLRLAGHCDDEEARNVVLALTCGLPSFPAPIHLQGGVVPSAHSAFEVPVARLASASPYLLLCWVSLHWKPIPSGAAQSLTKGAAEPSVCSVPQASA